MKRAKIIQENIAFPEKPALVCPLEEPKLCGYMFRAGFHLEKLPQKAVMIISSSSFCELSVNGDMIGEYAIRSYVYKRAYEAYDIKEYLQVGRNTIAIGYTDCRTPVNRGFVCEMIADGVIVPLDWRYSADASYSNVAYYIMNPGGAEQYDGRSEVLSWRENRFDDGAWRAPCISVLAFEDGVCVYQSKQKPQTHREIQPESIVIDGYAERYSGKSFCFQSEGASIYFAKLTVCDDADVSVFSISSVASVYIDGRNMETDAARVSAGTHMITVFSRANDCSFEVRSEAKLEFSEWKTMPCPEPESPFFYPWNENVRPYQMPLATAENIRKSASVENFEKCDCGAAICADQTLWNSILSRRLVKNETVQDITCVNHGKSIFLKADDHARHIVADFGIERVGMVKLDFAAAEGAEIIFDTYEIIEKKGPRPMGKRSCGKIISRGEKQTFVSKRLRGFRYISVTLPKDCDIELFGISAIEKRYDTFDVGGFASNDRRLDEIYQMSVDTAMLCMLDSYVDCPGCEQNPWSGDAGITALINMTSFGEREFDTRYLGTIADSMLPGLRRYYRGSNRYYVHDTYLPCACFPTYPDAGIPIWSFTWVLHIFDHYRYFGRDESVKYLIPAVEECLKRCEYHMSERGLFAPDGAWNLIEWANNDLSPYGEVSANNMMLSYCYLRASEWFASLEDCEKAIYYKEKHDALKERINQYCWDEALGAYVDTVRDERAYKHYAEYCISCGRKVRSYEEYRSATRVSVQTAVFAILFDIAEGERLSVCEKLLMDDMKKGNFKKGRPTNRTFGAPDETEAPGGVVRTGTPFFLYYALGEMFKLGHHEEAIRVMKREWGEMLDDGIKTCVETFRRDDGEWGRSAAHAWGAAPAVYLKTEILGVRPIEDGYKKFTVTPHLCGLDSIAGDVYTPCGNIRVEVTRKNGEIKIKCDAPNECIRI